MQTVSYAENLHEMSKPIFQETKQEAHWPQMAHLIKTAIACSYCISANAMQLLPVLPQQLGQKSDHIIKRSKIILESSFQQAY